MIRIVHQLRRVNGSNAKLKVLKAHKDNDLWKAFLYHTYSPFLHYYTSAPSSTVFVDAADYEGMLHEASLLSDRKVTGKAAKEFAANMNDVYGEAFRLLLGKSIRAGVSVKTINKAYPMLIPEFNLMLAKDVPPESYPVWSSIKYDGVRAIAHVDGGRVTMRTRAGKELNIKSLIVALKNVPDGVYDGEIVSGDGKQAGRTKISGRVNQVLCGTVHDIDCTYCMFDWVPLPDWAVQASYIPYSARLARLKRAKGTNLFIVNQVPLGSASEVSGMFSQAIHQGYEGLILRYSRDPYIWKRSSRLIKKKAIHEATLRCTSIEEGTGKYEGMVGSLVCRGTVGSKEIQVKVGTGLSDFDRDAPGETYIGRQIEVEYNDIVKADGSSTYSLFLPRFKRAL